MMSEQLPDVYIKINVLGDGLPCGTISLKKEYLQQIQYTPHSKLQEAEEQARDLLNKLQAAVISLVNSHEHIAKLQHTIMELRCELDGGKTAYDILKGLGRTTND